METKVAEVANNEFVSHIETFSYPNNFGVDHINFAHKRHGQNIQECLYAKWFVEFYPKVSKFITDGNTVLDFGAYDGDTSIPLALAAGSGKCISFEPSLAFTYGLQINAGFNPKLNIQSHNVAATNKDAISEFNYDPKEEVGGHPLNTRIIGSYTRKRFVRTVDIRKFLEKEPEIHFIKSDTEGFDMQIVRLLIGRIKKHRPTIHIEWFHNTSRDIAQFVDYLSYKVIDFKDMKVYNSLPPVWTDDLLLVPHEKLD